MFGSRTTTRSSFEGITRKNYMWRSTDKNFFYYDRDKQERVGLPADAKLVPLTYTSSITGSRERDHNRPTQRYNAIVSNEFTDYKTDKVVVREIDRLDGSRNVVFEGPYSDVIKDAINDVPWARYTKNVYALLVTKDNPQGEVVKLSLSGASLSPWIEFENACKKAGTALVDSHYIAIGEPQEKVNGSVTFYAPTFELGDIDAELDAHATEVAIEVEEKIERNKYAQNTVEAPVDVYTATRQAPKTAPAPAEPVNEINLDEVPF